MAITNKWRVYGREFSLLAEQEIKLVRKTFQFNPVVYIFAISHDKSDMLVCVVCGYIRDVIKKASNSTNPEPGRNMTQFLPANLLALFAPRDPLPYLPPPQPKHVNEDCTLTGVGLYGHLFEDPAETPQPVKCPSRLERKEAKRVEKEEAQKNRIAQVFN